MNHKMQYQAGYYRVRAEREKEERRKKALEECLHTEKSMDMKWTVEEKLQLIALLACCSTIILAVIFTGGFR